MIANDLIPWNDRAGKFSAVRSGALLLIIAPAIWLAAATYNGELGVEPVKAATHLTGEWALWALLAGLAVSPLRRLLNWSELIGLRRMIGVSSFAYVLAHFGLYVLYQNGDLIKVASEIASRSYLTIGFVALVGLAVLTATSFDAAMRRMGRNWHRLHRIIYLLIALGILHFFIQSKASVEGAAALSGVFAGLMYHRSVARAGYLPEFKVAIIAVLSGISAAGTEYLWHLTQTGLPADRIFISNFNFEWEIRFPWLVAAIMAVPLPLMLAQRAIGWARAYPPEAARKTS